MPTKVKKYLVSYKSGGNRGLSHVAIQATTKAIAVKKAKRHFGLSTIKYYAIKSFKAKEV